MILAFLDQAVERRLDFLRFLPWRWSQMQGSMKHLRFSFS